MKVLNHLAAALTLLGGSAVAAAQWSFNRIADTSTPAPGGMIFSSINSQPFLQVCLGTNGQVAFLGRHPGLTRPGIFQGTTGSLLRVADEFTLVPGVSGATFDQGLQSLSFDGVSPTFDGISSGAGVGIYSSGPQGLYTIVNSQTIGPGGEPFLNTGLPSRDGNAVAFGGVQNSNTGLYRWTPTGINAIVTLGTPQPGGTSFSGLSSRELTDQRLAFRGSSATLAGVYSRDASGTGPISTIADTTTLIPGVGVPFAEFGLLAADGPNTAFTGGTLTIGGVYAHLNDQIIRIADYTTPGPSGETFTQFTGVAISDNSVAFTAYTSLGPELFVWRNGALSRAAKFGDVLGGITLFDLSITSQAIRGDTVAFEFHTATGGGPVSGGVYTATFIPTPGAATVLLAAALNTRRRRRA